MSVSSAGQRTTVSTILRDGSAVRIRVPQPGDREALLSFYETLPREELLQTEHNPRNFGFFEEWLDSLEAQEILHLLAESEQGRVVGHCLVYHPPRGWKAHQGLIWITVLPEWRVKGLAGRMIEAMVGLCLESGLDLLVAEFLPEQEAARTFFSRSGFHHLATIPSFVRDLSGNDRDLILLARQIREQDYFAGD